VLWATGAITLPAALRAVLNKRALEGTPEQWAKDALKYREAFQAKQRAHEEEQQRVTMPKRLRETTTTVVTATQAPKRATTSKSVRSRQIWRGNPAKIGEMKFIDFAFGGAVDSVADIPTNGQLCRIPQDATQSGRVGRKVTIKRIEYRMTLYQVAGASASADTVRFCIVQDKQANGAAAAINLVFDSSSDIPIQHREMENIARFKLLKDKTVTLNPGYGINGAVGASAKTMNGRVKCSIPIEYDNSAATGDISTVRRNNIFVTIGAGIQDDFTQFEGNIRVFYVDNNA